jgi:hypothetical protein
MKLAQIYFRNRANISGAISPILLWILGVPLPIILLVCMIRS